MSAPRAIINVAPKVGLEIMSRADLERIHTATLAYLEQAGVRISSATALDLLSDAGAIVDHATATARISADLVEKALAQAPAAIMLAGRADVHDVTLDGEHCLLASGGPAELVRDAESGAVRAATASDLIAACTVVDDLPELAVLGGPPVRALDAPVAGRCLHELEVCFTHTTKHVHLAGPLAAHDAELVADMALSLAGSTSELRRRPPLSLCAAGAEALDAALVFAGRGLPVGVVAAAAGSDGAPAAADDLAAAVTLANASVLAALTVVQLAAPGAPFFYAAQPGLFGWADSLRGARANVFALAAAQLAHHYHVPLSASVLATGANAPDWQAGTQSSFGALTGTLAHAGLVVGAGLLGGGRIFSLQQLIMDSEIYSVAAKIAAGIVVVDDTIALETIEKVGIGGNYLSERHTRAHMKEVWRPRLLDRTPWDSWVQGGRKGSYDKATELLHSILESHQAETPGAVQAAELRHILEIADYGKEIR